MRSAIAGIAAALAAPLAIALSPAPVAAQQIAFAPAATEDCLAAAADPLAARACVGRAADACIDGPDGDTTAGMSACYAAERDWWQARLDTAYATLLALEEASTRDLAALGSAAPSTADALAAMQAAWLAYRDAACGYEVSTWGGGSGGGPAGLLCLMQLTGEYTLALEARRRAAAGP